MRATFYTNRLNIISYISGALSFVGYPLAFYIHYKYKMPIFMNVGAMLVVLPVFMIASIIPGCAVNAYIEDCAIVIEKYIFKAIWPQKARLQYLFSEIHKIETLHNDGKCFYNIHFGNGRYLSVPDMPSSYVDVIGKCYGREIFELPMPSAKEKQTIALILGIILLDIALIFAAIYLAT